MNDEQPTHFDLFSGIGGFSIAFEDAGFRTVAYSEINPDKCLVYEHHFPGVPNLGNIEGICGTDVRDAHGAIDVITGGVPCQPASALGQMRGTADERWLWPEAIRLVREIRPKFGVFENPPSILVLESGRAWNGIVSGLVKIGYDLWWDVFPAAAFGAGHLRERIVLVIADSEAISKRIETDENDSKPKERHARIEPSGFGDFKVASNTHHAGLEGHSRNGEAGSGQSKPNRSVGTPNLRGRCDRSDWWHEVNTGVPVLAHGLPGRLVEAAAGCAGDAVVPQVIEPIARAIYEMLKV